MNPLLLLCCLAQTTSPEHGSLQPEQATYSVGAAGGSIMIRVTRAVGSTGNAGCTWSLIPGTATSGVDYTATAGGTLSWTGGDMAPKTVTIAILNAAAGVNRSFKLRLSSPTSSAWLGSPATFPVMNHAVPPRVLNALPAISGPIQWNTAQADAILSNLQILPKNNPWNEIISDAVAYPVLANSGAMLGQIGNSILGLNRDMNFCVVPADQGRKAIALFDYGDESDPGPYPVPDLAPIENWPMDDPRTLANIQLNIPFSAGDRHSLTLDPVNGFLYEFGIMSRDAFYIWIASTEATFNLRSNTLRPNTWTSTDAAGLPILPSIPRFDECERGMVDHALRFTVPETRNAFVYPATHQAAPASNNTTNYPRMGERFRLKKTVAINNAIAGMSKHPKAIALALQEYGMFVADNGSRWRLSIGPDSRLTNLNELIVLQGNDFEAIQTTGANQGPRALSEATITITPAGPPVDIAAPSVGITSPAGPTYSATASPLALSGTAADNTGVTLVTWSTDRLQSGVANGLGPWTASIPLVDGTNVVTVTAIDAAGHVTTSTLTVTYSAPAVIPTPVLGGGGGGGGGCGLSGLELLLLWLLRSATKPASQKW